MRLLSIFILLFLSSTLYAQKHILLDSSRVIVRNLDQQELRSLKDDKDFQYVAIAGPPQNFWDKFLDWLWRHVDEVMSTKTGQQTRYFTMIIVAVLVILFFILKVTGMNRSGLLGRNSDKLAFSTSVENIHDISFEDAISAALESKNFRLAVRLLYLQSLKRLSDKSHITWQIDKSNTDYIKEVAGKSWHTSFKKLTYNFEYAWYGERPVAKEAFEELRKEFKQFNTAL